MSDITMCTGAYCPLKTECYRFLAAPSHWQSFFAKPPWDEENKTCEMFWPIKKEDDIQDAI